MIRSRVLGALAGTGFLAVIAVSSGASAGEMLAAANPQPGDSDLKPGLSVQYFIDKFDHIDEVINASTWMQPVRGEPLAMLNYNVGAGPVLSNHNEDMVGAFIQGYIRIEQPGTYLFSVQHNDGVRLWIGDKLIYDSPMVTPDLFSPNLEVVADKSGWYPIKVIYFEKKSTSTLELYWQPPGADGFVFVPADAFRHVPGEDEITS